MTRKTSIEDVNEALKAKSAEQIVGLNSGETQSMGIVPKVPFQQRIENLAGKKLISNFSCIRAGQEIYFAAGTKWEEIPSIYKIGIQKIDFPAEIFK